MQNSADSGYHSSHSDSGIRTSLTGNYENVLPGVVLIKNNLVPAAASEQTLLFILLDI